MRKYLRRILIGLFAIIIVIVAVGVILYIRFRSEPPRLDERAGDLAFLSDREGNWDIFVLDSDGNLQNLTTDSPGNDFFFSYTFEADRLNFYTNTTGEFSAAQVLADGSGFRTMNFLEAVGDVLASGQVDFDPRWSPDGQKLLWSSMRDFNGELYLADPDGSNSERLTNGNRNDLMMAWSPDGQKIVFTSDRDGVQDVYVLDVASGEQTRLTDETGWDYQPVWSMDGEQILFVSDRDDALKAGQFDLFLVNPDGTGEHPFGEDDVFTGGAAYSPDGKQVAYMSNEEGSWHIYIMDIDGSNVRRLTDGNSNNIFPAWRPIPQEEGAEAEAE